MKVLIIFIVLISFNGLIIAQNPDEARLKKSIDSLQNIVNDNYKKIDSLETYNSKLDLAIKNHSDERNKILNEGKIGDIFVYCIMGTKIYDKPDFQPGFKQLGEIKTGDKVKVIDSLIKRNYKVYFNGIEGYALKLAFISENEAKYKLEQDSLLKEKQLLAIENRKKGLIKKYGQTNGTKIFNQKIWIGMTKDMLFESWGQPDNINRSVGAWGVHEQMIYGNTNVYIENDVLTSWQD